MSEQNKFNQADHRGGNDECLTPPHVIQAVGGPDSFDLDPCAAPKPRPWPTAKKMISLPDDGLSTKWFGRVWCNQPYSDAATWAVRMAQHDNGIMLVFSRTGTRWFQYHVFGCASAILFLSGRLSFYDVDGDLIRTKKGHLASAGAPSCLVAYGKENVSYLYRAVNTGALTGTVLELPRRITRIRETAK